MRSRLFIGVACVAAALPLAGCSTLPSTGPGSGQIGSGTSSLNSTKDYVVVDMTQQIVDVMSQYRVMPFAKRFAAPRPAPGQIVGLGDVLNVTLFEAGQGGLFASDYGARVTFPQRVDSDGSITVPYAGRIKASGESPQTVERRIVAALEGRAIQPQAIVTIQETVSRSYVVNGEVGGPARLPITAAGDRILDAIALAGGSKMQPFETRITLQRGSAQGTAMMKDLIDRPDENVFVQPNDRIYVTKDPMLFMAYGAVSKQGPTQFGLEKISLLEAVGMAGGLLDARSDPGGFFLFRYEPSSAVKAIRPDYDGRFGDKVPVVYRINLRDPRAYFYARAFEMRDRDVLYVANSPLTELQKFLQILGSARDVLTTVNSGYTFGQRVGLVSGN